MCVYQAAHLCDCQMKVAIDHRQDNWATIFLYGPEVEVGGSQILPKQ